MKKGFTMIEILAVFTLTAVILLITVPFIINSLKSGNEIKYDQFIDTISIAAEAYMNDLDDVTDPVTVTLMDLVDAGYLKSTTVNPYNNKKVTNSENDTIKIKITKNSEGILSYEIEGLN